MREIPVGERYVALVDDEDYERVSQYIWSCFEDKRSDGSIRTVYASRSIPMAGTGRQRRQQLHRFILEVDDPSVFVDHRNGNGLDCRRENIRTCDPMQNAANVRKHYDNTSGYKGVTFHRASGLWHAVIMVRGRVHSLGYFRDPAEAGSAYQDASVRLRGEFAPLEDLDDRNLHCARHPGGAGAGSTRGLRCSGDSCLPAKQAGQGAQLLSR